jgi:hypothetical protein
MHGPAILVLSALLTGGITFAGTQALRRTDPPAPSPAAKAASLVAEALGGPAWRDLPVPGSSTVAMPIAPALPIRADFRFFVVTSMTGAASTAGQTVVHELAGSWLRSEATWQVAIQRCDGAEVRPAMLVEWSPTRRPLSAVDRLVDSAVRAARRWDPAALAERRAIPQGAGAVWVQPTSIHQGRYRASNRDGLDELAWTPQVGRPDRPNQHTGTWRSALLVVAAEAIHVSGLIVEGTVPPSDRFPPLPPAARTP